MADKNIYDKIQELVRKHEKEVIEIRRDIHMHPELSFQETRTAALVVKKLRELGLEVKTGIAKTGVVGILKGKNPGKTVALRADMDALPLEEQTDLPFKSVNNGVMHACGHDCHTANLLGVAMILSELKDELKGTVKFVFQPAEEKGCGGGLMVNEGVLENPKVDAAFGLHVGAAPFGTIRFTYGPMTAFTDTYTLRVKGQKAHTSMPQKGIDAILIAAHIITTLQSILTRYIDPTEPATFSLSKIIGGTAANIVPDLVEVQGCMRCTSKETRKIIIAKMKEISHSVAESMGGDCEFILDPGYTAVFNEKKVTDLFKETVLERYENIKYDLGLDITPDFDINNLILNVDKPSLGGEDFGFFAQQVPSCFFFIGSGDSAPQHHSKFMVDEKVFKIGLNLLASVAVKFLDE